MTRIFDIIQLMLNDTVPTNLRGHPEYGNWGAGLAALSQTEGLAPLQEVLGAIAKNALSSTDPWNHFLTEEAAKVPFEVYLRGSDVAEKALSENPTAAFLLALVCLSGWASALGENLYLRDAGMPHFGWARLPYVCALAALKIDAHEGAKLLADEGYQVLMSCKYCMDDKVVRYLDDYHQLSGRIQRKYEMAVANLAEDLRDSCRPGEHHFRPEVGALLWSMGLVPESYLLKSTASPDFLPSRRLCKNLVRQSMQCIPTDSLIQYIWLELKDRLPFNIRDHSILFPIINRKFAEWMLDDFMPVGPSRAYAQALIGWFKGDLPLERAGVFYDSFELVAARYPEVNLADFSRMATLAQILSKEFGFIKKDAPADWEIKGWYRLADMSRSVRSNYNMHPDWPEIYGRPNICLFHLIEDTFSKISNISAAATEELEKVIMALESLRSAAFSYWLEVAPPFPSPEEETFVKNAGEEEEQLLIRLRGAYFQILMPILPRSYLYYDGEISTILAGKKLGPDRGRQEYRDILDQLTALLKKWNLEETAPHYARKRSNPTASLSDLVTALGSHS